MTKPSELIERTSKVFPAAVRGVNEDAAAKLLRAVFATLARDIDQAPDGPFKIAGLGTFIVRTVEAKAEGKGGGRRVGFRAAKPKVGGGKTRKAAAGQGEAPAVSGSE